jgi:hypothetical protein
MHDWSRWLTVTRLAMDFQGDLLTFICIAHVYINDTTCCAQRRTKASYYKHCIHCISHREMWQRIAFNCYMLLVQLVVYAKYTLQCTTAALCMPQSPNSLIVCFRAGTHSISVVLLVMQLACHKHLTLLASTINIWHNITFWNQLQFGDAYGQCSLWLAGVALG